MSASISSSRFKSIVVLTGAGVSRASGLKAFRGGDGIWDAPDTARLSSAENLLSDPDSYWRFWGKLKVDAIAAQPNAAHLALANWELQLRPETRYLLITQNVDGLHQRAGSRNLVEIHGSIFKTRCSNNACKLKPYDDLEAHLNGAPECPACGSALRPDLTLFNEALPLDAEYAAKKALRTCDLFIAVGTSATVSPASRFVEWAKYAQAQTILINQDIPENSQAFDSKIAGLAEEILPDFLK